MQNENQKDAVIQELEDTLTVLREEYDTTKRKIEKEKIDLDRIYQDIISVERTLSIRRRQLHLPETTEILDSVLADDAEPPLSAKKKTDFVLSVIKSDGSLGTSPKDIFNAFDKSGAKYYKNYIYTILLRLKRQGKISEKGGKYFLAE